MFMLSDAFWSTRAFLVIMGLIIIAYIVAAETLNEIFYRKVKF